MTDFKHGLNKKIKDHICLVKKGDPIEIMPHLGNKWFGKCSICGRKIKGKIIPNPPEDL